MLQPVFNRPTQRIGMTYLTWVGTPNRLYGEDILSAPGWRHPPCILSCGNRYVASECNLLTTRAVYLKSWLFDWLSNSATWVVPVLVLLLVALWFILRGDLLYVFPCVILFLCFSVLLVLRLPRLGKRELILVLFVRLFGLCFRFVDFLFLLGAGKGCGLWLWHSLDFSLTFFYRQVYYSHTRSGHTARCLYMHAVRVLARWPSYEV